jgi:hypothetical protein
MITATEFGLTKESISRWPDMPYADGNRKYVAARFYERVYGHHGKDSLHLDVIKERLANLEKLGTVFDNSYLVNPVRYYLKDLQNQDIRKMIQLGYTREAITRVMGLGANRIAAVFKEKPKLFYRDGDQVLIQGRLIRGERIDLDTVRFLSSSEPKKPITVCSEDTILLPWKVRKQEGDMSEFKDGDTVLIKARVNWGSAKPGRMVRCIAKDEPETPLWISPEEVIPYPPSGCDGNGGGSRG